MEQEQNLEKTMDELTIRTRALFERFQINHIFCISSKIETEKWTFQKLGKYLNSSNYNKIEVNSAIFLNSLKNPKLLNQISEDEDLRECIQELIQFIKTNIEPLSQKGENRYPLNTFLRTLIKETDHNIGNMNYDKWLEIKDPFNNDNIFHVLIKKELFSYRKIFIDIETFCLGYVQQHFLFRKLLLHELKNIIVDIFSNYILLPDLYKTPKISYSCQPIDICELIMAISNSNYITDSEKLKPVLMELFDISPVLYGKLSYSIRNRVKTKSQFLQRLSDSLNRIPSSKSKPASQ